MAEFEPLRTGQLVIRRHAPWRRRLLGGGGLILGAMVLYGMYEWGRYSAGHNQLESVIERRGLQSKVEALERENDALRGQITAVDTTRDVDRQSYADVERTLGELQAQVLRQSEELTFYRGIVAPADGIGGLRIQRLEVLPGGSDRHFRLRVVLVQAMRQDAVVAGSVGIDIEGALNASPATLSLAEAGGNPPEGGRLPFSFRYFQNIEQDVMLPEGFEPLAVNVEVRSGRQPAVRQAFPWQVRTTG
jgi:outer membrane murein-binding lipoprotein Lpp